MKKEISLGLILIVVLSLAGNALATRELWVRDLTGVNRWDNAWNKIDRLAAAQNIYAPGCVVQNPHTGEILVAVRSSNISTAEAILRYDQSSGAYLGLWTDLTDMEGQGPNNMTFGDDGDLYITGNSNIWKYDGISAAPKGASAGDPYLAHDASNLKSVAVKDGLVFTGRYGAGGIAYYDASTGTNLGTLVDASIPGSSGGPGVLIGPDGKLYSSNYSARVLQWDLSGGIGTFPTLTATVFVDGSSGGPDGLVLDKNSDLAWNTEEDWLSVMPDAEATIRSFYDDGVAPALPWRFKMFSANDIDAQGWLGSPCWVDPDAIPEPATLGLLLIGGLAGLIRRR